MDFHVIHFDYDSQITAVNSSKVQSKDVLKPGERCTVPFETEDLLEDGRTKYRDVLYEGTVICLNLGMFNFGFFFLGGGGRFVKYPMNTTGDGIIP